MKNDFKILIVDDEPRNLRILEEILEGRCILEQAIDGEQTLKKVDTFGPDLILLDGMMPGKTGLEVCEQLKADARHCHIKIIFITGKASNLERKQGLAAGADGYVTKPFEETEIFSAIEQLTV